MMDVTVFVAFVALQCGFQSAHKLSNSKFSRWIAGKHWLVWLVHPAVLHGVQDYAIHVVVYSGRVIAAH